MTQTVKNLLQCKRPRFNPWVKKIPRSRKWQPTPVFLPGKFHGQRSLAGDHMVAKSQTWLSDMTGSLRDFFSSLLFFLPVSSSTTPTCSCCLTSYNRLEKNCEVFKKWRRGSKQKGSASPVGKGVWLATYERKKGNDMAKLNRKFTQGL